MHMEMRLKKILADSRLDERGVIQKIAEETGLHRHTVRKIYHNKLRSPSLDTLEKICDWLIANGVPRSLLPHGLFGMRPSDLWQAIAAPGEVVLFIGKHTETRESNALFEWIAQRDAGVMARIVQLLSEPGQIEQRPKVRIEYVPFRFERRRRGGSNTVFEEDAAKAAAMYEALKTNASRRSAILIGSQRVNYLVECLIADLFGCKPFVPVQEQDADVPIYHIYRDAEHSVPSCFGGEKTLPGCTEQVEPGTYYRDANGEWQGLPWKRAERDAGIVITVRNPGSDTMRVAVFGLSGWGTAEVGRQLCINPDFFWQAKMDGGCPRVNVFVCSIVFAPNGASNGEDEVKIESFKVIPLDNKMLKKYLR